MINCFDEGGKVYLDLPVVNDNVFWFFPDGGGRSPDPASPRTRIIRRCFDMNGEAGPVTGFFFNTLLLRRVFLLQLAFVRPGVQP